MTLISSENIKYYTHPHAKMHLPPDYENRQVYVTESRRDSYLTRAVPVVRMTTDHQRLYYVTTGSDRVMGHPYDWCPESTGTYKVAFLGPNQFAAVYVTERGPNQRGFAGTIQAWSDGMSHVISSGMFKYGVPMADWGLTLWPNTKDSPEAQAAKIASAKMRWEQEQKKLALLNEAHIRGWTGDLAEIRSAGHSFPQPVYSLYLSGRMLMKAGRKPTAKAIEKLNEEHRAVGSTVELNHAYVESFVAQPFHNLFAEVNLTQERLALVSHETLIEAVRRRYNDYSLDASITSRAPYMSGASA